MTSVEQQHYQVLIAPENGSAVWRAVVLGLPAVFARAESREAVIEQIWNRLGDALQWAEIISITPATPDNGSQDRLAAMGWDDYGIFKDDPEALKLFDEIEEERNKHYIEPMQT
jgi:uncharacterized protein YciW